MIILMLASLLSAAQAQFPAFTDVSGVPAKPWAGPIADHQLGLHPPDTPEVEAAKVQHLKAYREILAVLPELPPEERYRKHGLPLPAVIALQKQAHDQLKEAQAQYVQPVVVQTHNPSIQPVFPVIPYIQTFEHDLTPIEPTILAEDVPRSPTGEVPEVYAARLAHLKALEESRAASLGRL